MATESPWTGPAASAGDDDDLLVRVVSGRARSAAVLSILFGTLSLLASTIPCTGVTMPIVVYGMLTLIPIVGGLLAIGGAVQAARIVTGVDAGVDVELSAGQRSGPMIAAVVGASLGVLAVLGSVINLLLLQVSRHPFVPVP